MAAKPELQEFGEALRRARQDAGMSLRDLADAVDASHTVVAQWERAEHAPRPPRVRMLEHVLKLRPGSLAKLVGYWPVADEEDAEPVTVLEAAESDPRLDDRDRRILSALYRELVRKTER